MKKNESIFLHMSQLCEDNSWFDYHMHSKWTDGKAPADLMIQQAIKNGMKAIAITDHIRKGSTYYAAYLEELSLLKKKYSIELFSGFEAKILNEEGEIDIPNEAVEGADFIIASVHRLPYADGFCFPKALPQDELATAERKLILGVIEKAKNVNVIGHCGGMSIATYNDFPEVYFEEIIIACAAYNVAFEFNYKYHYRYEKLLKKLLAKYDPYISVGSDAHDTSTISKRSFYGGSD